MKSSLKIAIIGATGNVGRRITDEALNRGHQVTGIAPGANGNAPQKNLILKDGDLRNPEALAKVLKGHDVVVSSVKYVDSDPHRLLEALRLAGIMRYLVVGGAATLEVKPGVTALASGATPDHMLPEARGAQQFLDVLRSTTDISWTVLTPPAEFSAGERKGQFRLGKNEWMVDKNGKSAISFEDFAVALLDEIENPQHLKDRFSIAY
jgi:uncharacterized protein